MTRTGNHKLFRIRVGHPLRILHFGVALIACRPIAASADTTRTAQTVAPGVTFTQELTTGDHPLVINCVHVDLNTKTVHVRCGQANDTITLNGPSKGREQLHQLASRNGAVAAINADYFPFTGNPLGLEVRNGELLREPMEYRACMGLSTRGVLFDVLDHYGTLDLADGTPLSLTGINRVPQPGEIIAQFPVYASAPRLPVDACVVTLSGVNLPMSASKAMHGTVASVVKVPAGTGLPQCPAGSTLLVAAGSAADTLLKRVREGDTVNFEIDLIPSGPAPARGKYAARTSLIRGAFKPVWADVDQAVGGGPWLVRNGQIQVDWQEEGMNRVTFVDRRHPRTAVGVTADNVLLLVEVDGRSGLSQGATLDELAAIMKQHGALNAMNLDGGGSSTMIVQGSVVNAPSDGRERPIADALLVYSDVMPEIDQSSQPPPTVEPIVLRAGESMPLKVSAAQGPQVDPTEVMWGTGDGLGFVNQRGLFMASHAGVGTVVAHAHGAVTTIPITVLPAEPSVLKGTLAPITDYPPYYNQLTVTVTDRFGNPISGVTVTAELMGGELDGVLTTNANGQATAQVVWDVAPDKRIVGLAAPTIKQIVVKAAARPAKPNTSQDPDDK